MKKPVFISVMFFLVCGLSFPAYSGMFDRGPESAKVRKSGSLVKAEQAFLKEDYEEAVIICNAYVTHGDKIDDELQYIAGRALLKLGRFAEARNRFSRILNDNDSDIFLDKAYIGLADSYFLEKNYEEAKSYYEKVIGYFPDSGDIHTAYYKLGECHAKLGDRETSKKYYGKLVKSYPESLEAKLLVGEKSDFVTYCVQLGSFTKWKNAKNLHDELKKKGFDVNIVTARVGDSRFYRVRVGQYNRFSDAEDKARELRNKGYAVKIYP